MLKPLAQRWLLALLLWLPMLAALAQGVPPRPNPPRLVNDLAGLMQPSEADQLERKLVAYNDSASSQIAVVTVPSMGGEDIADYSQQLYQSWGIGQKGKNNGILILVAKEERTARIQTGYGLEGAVPDAIAKRIISNTLVPAFKQNQYYAGLDRATDQLVALAKGEYKVEEGDVVSSRGQGQRSRDGGGSGWSFWLIIGLLVLFFIFRNRGGGGGRRSGFGGAFIPPIIFGDFSGGRGVFGGGGGFGGGFGGGGGGGFGGFGGGSSGGGGASGSW